MNEMGYIKETTSTNESVCKIACESKYIIKSNHKAQGKKQVRFKKPF